jgi:uncharacterized protein (DUF305 family)
MHRLTRASVLTAAALAVSVLAASSCAGDTDATNVAGAADMVGAADVKFAQMMIPHHEQAVEMARMAARDGVSDDVVALAAAIRDAQQPEIDLMTAWLAEWGAESDPHAAHMGHDMAGMMSQDDMAALDAATGADFERTWLQMMIEHHRGAVTMAQQVLADGSDARVLDLARAIIAAQQREIDQMTQMLAQR